MDIGKFLGLDKFDHLLGRLEQRPLRIYAGQCLRRRDKTVDCDRCAGGCPVEAIDLREGVQVDFDRCLNCGICVNICPTGVFEPRLAEDYLLSRIQQQLKESESVGFLCPKQISQNTSNTIPQVEVPCLGRLNETLLVGAAVFGAKKIWLSSSGCADCPCETGLPLAGEMVRAVDKLLGAWGHPVEFFIAAEPPAEAGSLPAAGEDREEYDRRELLAKFGREALAASLGLAQGRIDRLSDIFDKPAEENLTYRLPRRRELLLRLLKKLGPPPDAGLKPDDLPLYGLSIASDRCNLCGNCVLFCPTRGLTLERGEDAGEIGFAVSRCLACDLCLKACGPGALTIDETIRLTDIFDDSYRPLASLSFYQCEKCKQKFASSTKQDICDFCRLREDKLQDDSWS